jgi:hypothetical protein
MVKSMSCLVDFPGIIAFQQGNSQDEPSRMEILTGCDIHEVTKINSKTRDQHLFIEEDPIISQPLTTISATNTNPKIFPCVHTHPVNFQGAKSHVVQ